MAHSKLTSILIIFTFSIQLCISEEICSVIEKRGKDFKPCIFPFTYKGVTYINCTDIIDPESKPWCSTKVDEEGNHVEFGGFWGHCGQDCPTNSFQEKAEYSISSLNQDFSNCGEKNDPSRIIDSSSVGIWPWMASLGFWSEGEWNHLCGATLISQTRIITAAHCVAPENDVIKRLKVRLGDDNHTSANDDRYVQDKNIEHAYIHPKYIESKAYYDIAVLIIPPIQFTKRVRPICLPPTPLTFEQDKYEGWLSTLIGWGTDFYTGKASATLKKTTLVIYDYSYCNTTHERTSGSIAGLVEQYLPQLFQPNLLCAGYESDRHGSCQGDSGGPLMVFNTKTSQYFQLGMVSGGVSTCGDKEIPGYYTRLDYPEIAEFIEEPDNSTTKKEEIQYPENSIYIKYEGDVQNGEPSGTGTMTYKNGNKYEGEWKNGKQEGMGILTFNNGSGSYSGQWKNGKKSGHGNLTLEIGSVYVGEFENDKRNGFGKFTYSSGSTYEGQWRDDVRSGNGTFISQDGDEYVGEFKNDLKNGYGILNFNDGDTYEGQWKDNEQSGNGTYTWIDGDSYVGEWENDSKSGFGIYSFDDGSKYEGEFENDNSNGFGKRFFSNGDTYEGQWEDDIQSGNGTFIWKDGDKYVGEFENDMKNGFGIFTYDDGRTYEGQWEDDKKSGKGTFTNINGEKYVGEFKNDLKHGSGVEYSSHGEIINQGQWEEGKFISE